MRFRAPRVGLPEWAEDAPDRSLFVSNVTGTYELYAWDRATGGRRQVTDRPNGTTDGSLSRDGAWVWWFSDTDGDEFGIWMRQPFAGGEDVPAAPGLAPSYPAGLALGVGGLAVIGRSTDDEGTSVHVVRPDGGSRRDLPAPGVRGRRRPLGGRHAGRHRAHRARRRHAQRPARAPRRGRLHRRGAGRLRRAAGANWAWTASGSRPSPATPGCSSATSGPTAGCR